MKYRSVQILTAAAVIAGAARTASAADQSGAWSLSIIGGDSIGETGSLRSPVRTTITDLGSLDPTLAGASGTLSFDKLKYEALFKRRYDFGVRLSLDANHFGTPPSADDTRLSGLGFNAGNDAQSRWSFPLAIAASYHF